LSPSFLFFFKVARRFVFFDSFFSFRDCLPDSPPPPQFFQGQMIFSTELCQSFPFVFCLAFVFSTSLSPMRVLLVFVIHGPSLMTGFPPLPPPLPHIGFYVPPPFHSRRTLEYWFPGAGPPSVTTLRFHIPSGPLLLFGLWCSPLKSSGAPPS